MQRNIWMLFSYDYDSPAGTRTYLPKPDLYFLCGADHINRLSNIDSIGWPCTRLSISHSTEECSPVSQCRWKLKNGLTLSVCHGLNAWCLFSSPVSDLIILCKRGSDASHWINSCVASVYTLVGSTFPNVWYSPRIMIAPYMWLTCATSTSRTWKLAGWNPTS